jgi:hypothetical protein
MIIRDYLRRFAQPMPGWLFAAKPDHRPPLDDVFASRTVYYPGALSDGHPLTLFAASHAAHFFVYVDYGLSEAEFKSRLSPGSGQLPLGYETLGMYSVGPEELAPAGWTSHLDESDLRRGSGQEWVTHWMRSSGATPYAVLVVFRRTADYGDGHGPERFALLQICADGIATYAALFCQAKQRPPWALILHDFGLGGNYDSFAVDGLMHCIAQRAERRPDIVLFEGAPHRMWDGYEPIPGVSTSRGGMGSNRRTLYQRRCPEDDTTKTPRDPRHFGARRTDRACSDAGRHDTGPNSRNDPWQPFLCVSPCDRRGWQGSTH